MATHMLVLNRTNILGTFESLAQARNQQASYLDHPMVHLDFTIVTKVEPTQPLTYEVGSVGDFSLLDFNIVAAAEMELVYENERIAQAEMARVQREKELALAATKAVNKLIRQHRRFMASDNPMVEGPSVITKRRKGIVSRNNRMARAAHNRKKFGVYSFTLDATSTEVDLSEEEAHFADMDTKDWSFDQLLSTLVAKVDYTKVNRRQRQKARRDKGYTRVRTAPKVKVTKTKTCNAITKAGTRCTRTRSEGFKCYQHQPTNVVRTNTRFTRRIQRWVTYVNKVQAQHEALLNHLRNVERYMTVFSWWECIATKEAQ